MDTQTALVPVYKPTDADLRIVGSWLQTKQSEHTRRAYRRVVFGLLNYVKKPLPDITHDDAQAYLNTLQGENSTVALAYNVVKSLFTFASDLGNIGKDSTPIANIAKTLNPPTVEDDLAQRILSEADVIRMIDKESDKRNHAMLRLMYHAGLRVSEVVGLRWEKVREGDNGPVLDVFGKGGKTRHVLISKGMYDELRGLNGAHLGDDRYVFQSRKGKAGTLPMETRQVDKIVLEAAKRAGIAGNVSAHWLRHSHATHSLKNGSRHEVLQSTLGHKSITTTMRYVHLNPDESSSQFIKV